MIGFVDIGLEGYLGTYGTPMKKLCAHDSLSFGVVLRSPLSVVGA
jgi:hypothetical protein